MEWKKPCITRVELDPEQAVLTTCAVDQGNGAWLNTTGGNLFCFLGLNNGSNRCRDEARGSFGDHDRIDPTEAGS